MAQDGKCFAEFFAGIGLVRAGLEPGGWQCAYANDIEPKKFEMYRHAFGPDHYDCGDIWDFDRVMRLLPHNLTLATASFPCTDLSLAGHWRGMDGKHSSSFFGFTEVLRRMGPARPAITLIENVPGLLTSHAGADFARLSRELASLGYWLDAMVIDARAFVPQSRPRVFIVGVQPILRHAPVFGTANSQFNGLFAEVEQGLPPTAVRPDQMLRLRHRTNLSTGWLNSALPNPPTQVLPLSAFLDTQDAADWWSPADVEKHLTPMQAPSRGRLNSLLDSREVRYGAAFRRTRHGESRTEVRFDIAGCLRTPKGGSARQIVIRVGRGAIDMRWMTAREYARLQGAGDFPIKVPERQALFGFGDAVCVPVIEWLDRHLLSPLAEYSAAVSHVARGRGVAV
jgi:DNA (cytosine-5)-methyltransferase 1